MALDREYICVGFFGWINFSLCRLDFFCYHNSHSSHDLSVLTLILNINIVVV